MIPALICLIAFASIQCSRGNRTQPNESKVIVSHPGNERIFFQDRYGFGSIEYLMFLPLMHMDYEKGEPLPVLAERWEHSEDYREWTFFLRKDVKWHDGVPVTAHDIKFTMDLRKQVRSAWSGAYSVETLDDFTLKVIYKKPTDGRDTWYVYYPKHLLEGLDPEEFWDWDFWTHPVGNGPYRYVRHMPETMIEVEANPDYYRGKPKIERVILKFSQKPSLVELLSGNVGILWNVSRDMLLKLSGDDRFRSYYRMGRWIGVIYWNHTHPLFQSPEIRRALTMAINRRELSNILNLPEGVPILDAISTDRQFQQGLYLEPLPYNPEGARKLLERDGWRDTDGDGVRERDGEEFRFTVLTNGNYEKRAIYVQDQFRRIGVRMEIQTVNRKVTNVRLLAGKFAAAIMGFNNGISHPLGHITMFCKDSPLGYSNHEMIRLLNLAKDAIDLDRRDSIYQEIMPIFIEDMPITLLTPSVFTCIVHRRIKGLSSPFRSDPVRYMEHLWLEDEK